MGAELSGGEFWQGASVGLLTAGLNHVQKKMIDWQRASRGQKIAAILNAYREAKENGAVELDIRKIVDNFPSFGLGAAGEYGAAYLMIDGERMPVFMDIAIYENMKISMDFHHRVAEIPKGVFDGVLKNGLWATYSFHRGNIPMLLLQVPRANDNTFYNFITR